MKTMLFTSFAVVLGLWSGGCTSIKITPIDSSLGVTHVCIERNTAVQVPGFVQIVQGGFRRHGITTQVLSPPLPSDCEYTLTYTALRSWDMTTFLSHAELRLNSEDGQIAYAEYHLNGKGGYALTKYASTRSKMDPVLDRLLDGYALKSTPH